VHRLAYYSDVVAFKMGRRQGARRAHNQFRLSRILVKEYNRVFFCALNGRRSRSAEVIVPLIIELLHPCSVIDIGCGTGGWLEVFKNHHIGDILGVAGSVQLLQQTPD
jgi:hypothetical protein